MKLNKVLTINQLPRHIIDDKVQLDLYAPGAAQFTVAQGEQPIAKHQLVTFDLGYSAQAQLQRWFIGSVTDVVPMDDKRTKVFCRELTSALSHPLPLNCRHISLRDLTVIIAQKTGLNIATPEAEYVTKKVANFYNCGSGYLAIERIASVFEIDDYIWQQQSGVLYVGSWADSRWAKTRNMVLPNALFNNHGAHNTARVAALPMLRPGCRINGHRITGIESSQNHMVLSWA